MMVQITEDRLREMLTEASERGAIKALQLAGIRKARKWLTIAESLEILGCSRSTLARYERQGVLRSNGKAYAMKRYSFEDITKIKG